TYLKQPKIAFRVYSIEKDFVSLSLSLTKESTTPRDTVEDLKYLFESVLLSLTNREPLNTPLLVKVIRKGYSSAELPIVNKPSKPSQPYFSSNNWDKEVYKYTITEPVETSGGVNDYTEYIFVVCEYIDRISKEVVLFIDIKSEGLRDILRDILHNIKAVSLIEDKLSVIEIVLLLRKLDRYTENIDSSLDYKSVYTEYLLLLIDHLNVSNQYCSTVILYITFFRRFLSLWNLECRFIDYNGVKFGEARIFLRIVKFRGLRPIESLKAFPLRCYLRYKEVRKDLFRDLAGSYIRHCNGSTFFINKGKAIKVNVNSRVVVDATPESFDCLKIPSETKTILLLLAKTRLGIIPTVPFDNYIGKASIISRLPNLTYTSGPPGVGKTFTVKVTSEYFKLPLYSLKTVFKIAKYFNTVLLLDKVDVFIEQRISYYDTYNRLFNNIILSRIYLIIEYKNLTREFRRDLWLTFLSKEYELRRLESLALNRREIKNIAAIIYALAEADVN
ncbi:ATPase AAA-type core, partial [Penicillium vulpinum]|uniref:ATPase AAA-type core n=1 Tax=Penicillium vulpinum TaxID=29845 RepID=UPI002546DD49